MLTTDQQKDLFEAISRTFNESSLRRLLSLELGKKLQDISKGGTFSDIILDVIETTQMEGWMPELVDALHKARPREDMFGILAQKIDQIQSENAEEVESTPSLPPTDTQQSGRKKWNIREWIGTAEATASLIFMILAFIGFATYSNFFRDEPEQLPTPTGEIGKPVQREPPTEVLILQTNTPRPTVIDTPEPTSALTDLPTTPATPMLTNFIENGGFDEGENGMSNWCIKEANGTSASYEKTINGELSIKPSIPSTIPALTPTVAPWDLNLMQCCIPMYKGYEYTIQSTIRGRLESDTKRFINLTLGDREPPLFKRYGEAAKFPLSTTSTFTTTTVTMADETDNCALFEIHLAKQYHKVASGDFVAVNPLSGESITIDDVKVLTNAPMPDSLTEPCPTPTGQFLTCYE